MNVVIIGGGTAGVEVALNLRKLDKDVRVTIIDNGRTRPYSPCGLPYVMDGAIKSFEDLFVFDEDVFSSNDINFVNGRAVRVDRKKKSVSLDRGGRKWDIRYDWLVMCSGSRAFVPKINGLGSSGAHVFKTMDDARGIVDALSPGMKVAVIGAGYVGVELAYALSKRGVSVSLLEALDHILAGSFDRDISSIISGHLSSLGVSVRTGVNIEKAGKGRIVIDGDNLDFDCIVVACGVVPDVGLALDAGLECGRGIIVDENMRTSDKYIYACGDCVEVPCAVDGKRILSMLGSSAVREARIAAFNVLGGDSLFGGVLNTSVSAVGGLVFGSTGLTAESLKKDGVKTVFGTYRGHSRSEYYPGSGEIVAKVVADARGRIMGFQIAGSEDIAGRLNTASLAISCGLSVDKFASLETCYNPAVASVFDPLVMACEVCRRKLEVVRRVR